MNNKYYYSPYLAHHGIKGQKWGVRRFQNEDGSLTNRGKQRYDHELKYKSRTVDDIKTYGKTLLTTVAASEASRAIPYAGIALSIYGKYKTLKNAKQFVDMNMDSFDYTKAKKDGSVESITSMKKLANKETFQDSVNAKNVNPYSKKRGGYNNCTNCAIAVDMRQRGYDIQARRRGQGRSNKEIISMYKNATIKQPNSSLNPEYGDSRKQYVKRSYDNFCKSIESEGKNSRGIVTLQFQKGRFDLSSSGHAFNYEVKDGKVSFYDAQRKGVDVDKTFSFGDPKTYTYIRTDNKQPSDKIGEAVVSKKRKK